MNQIHVITATDPQTDLRDYGLWTAVLTQSLGRQTYLSEVEEKIVVKRIMVLAMPPKIRRETRHSGTTISLNFCCLELAPASKEFPVN